MKHENDILNFDLANMTPQERVIFLDALNKTIRTLRNQGHRLQVTRSIPPPAFDNKISLKLAPLHSL